MQRYVASRLYLEMYYQAREAFVVGDDPATSFDSVGAVLLAHTHSRTDSAVELSSLTGLPVDFVIAVLRIADATNLWSSDRYPHLLDSLRKNPDDFDDVTDSLQSVQELFFNACSWEQIGSLKVLRNSMLIGGLRQWWVDVEN